MAMLSMAALLLCVQSGCGSSSSASSNASVTNQPAKSVEPQSSTPTGNAAATTPTEISSTEPVAITPAVATSDSDATVSGAASASPDAVASENPGSSVRPTTIALVNSDVAAEPAKKPQSAAESVEKPADPNRTNNYSFDDLKFDIEKGAPFERSMLPKKIENYVGQRVSIRGFILPTSYQTGLTNFVLVRDNMECCFGPGAALYDCVVIEMAPGKSTDYSIRPVTVEGKFSIDEIIGPDRKHLAIYKIVGDKVE